MPFRTSYAAATLVAATAFFGCLPANAQWSGTIGYVSEYIFRGIPQKNSSASVGIEYGQSGFTGGAWAGDVGDGAEVDIYGGYAGENGDFGYGIGFTGYFYTGDFDDTYLELNLSGSYRFAALDVAIGQYENFAGPTQDYLYYGLTLTAPFGGYTKIAGFEQDFRGEYVELGYGTEVAEGLELSVALVFGNDNLLGTADENIVFGLTKSFSFQ